MTNKPAPASVALLMLFSCALASGGLSYAPIVRPSFEVIRADPVSHEVCIDDTADDMECDLGVS